MLLTLTGHAQAAICYAAPQASGTGSGASWAHATLLTDALASMPCTDIRLQQGLYAADHTLLVARNLTVRGGYTGVNPANPDERSADPSLTTLDGQGARRVLAIDGTASHGPINSETLLESLSIVNGNAMDESGGGLYCNGQGAGSACSPTLNNIIFKGNSAQLGGALFNDGTSGISSPRLTNITFTGNSAEIGGALLNRGLGGSSSPKLLNVIFTGNSASIQGGAMSNEGTDGISSPQLINVTFSGNTADENGGAVLNQASGSGSSNPIFASVTFSSNRAGLNGGAVASLGIAGGASSPQFINTTFTGNAASESGGAIASAGYWGGASSPVLTNATFSGNTAASYGGAVYNAASGGTSAPQMRNPVFWGNTADLGGPQVANDGSASATFTNALIEGGCPSGANFICTGTLIAANPGLGALQDNGGFTHTMMPGAGSPVLGQGDAATCPATDQRGAARPAGACDLGAVQRRRGSVELSVTVNAAGQGNVSGGIGACASTSDHCTATYAGEDHPLYATLTAAPAAGYQFSGWSGACANTSGTCTVTMDQARSAAAQFIAKSVPGGIQPVPALHQWMLALLAVNLLSLTVLRQHVAKRSKIT